MASYSEFHSLVSDAEGIGAGVSLRLTGTDIQTARLFVLRVLDVAGEFARSLDIPGSVGEDHVIRSQTSGPCVHYDERSEHAADTDPCTYPYGDGTCPHLDNPDVLCPVKDSLYAMLEVARMRGVCEAEQDEQDADMAAVAPSQTYETAAPEFVEPEPEEAAIRRPRFKAGDRVRISHQMFKGYTGTIRRYYAATEDYLTHIDGTTDTMWLSEDYLEAV